MAELLIARIDTFTKAGRYVPRGTTLTSDEVDYDADAANSAFISAPEGANEGAVVEVAAIAPTGPNPRNPQQIAPDVFQTTDGYVQAGARLVGEVTLPEKQRIEVVGIDPEDTTQAEVTQALADADAELPSPNATGERAGGRGSTSGNADDSLVDGTVADVTERIRDADDAELARIEAAENDRERPRAGVLNAIAARRDNA